MCNLLLVPLTIVFVYTTAGAQQTETINGTIYCNNDFSFYINGELIQEDHIPTAPHNAINVSFTVQSGKDIVFAIEGRDLADNGTGLECGDRCIGGGGLRAFFSNGVVTNSSWVCTTHHYGPLNWKQCFGAQMVRDQSLQVFPSCKLNSTPPLEGCVSRVVPRPEGWTAAGFDDSRWSYALEYEEVPIRWGLSPPGCEDPQTIVSDEVDENGDPFTCPRNLDWGESKFIWQPDIDLDNTILCRYTVRLEDSSAISHQAMNVLPVAVAVVASVGAMLF